MIKASLVTLVGVGGLGLNADHLALKSVELNAGAIAILVDGESIKTDVTPETNFAIKLNMKKGRVIAIRF